jgi:excisionase family DNA binding protein
MKRTGVTPDGEPILYSIPAAARKLSLSERTVYRLIDAGRIRMVNVGTTGRAMTRIRAEDLIAFVDASTVK